MRMSEQALVAAKQLSVSPRITLQTLMDQPDIAPFMERVAPPNLQWLQENVRDQLPHIRTIVELNKILIDGHYPEFGICSALTSSTIFRLKAEQWPEHSGNFNYPVPHELGAIAAYDAVVAQRRNPKMWTGSYGEARLRLAFFVRDLLISELPWLGEMYECL
jgi:hypothetical protein